MIPLEHVEAVDDFNGIGVRAFTTTRRVGSFSSGSEEPVREVMGRWTALVRTAESYGATRLATASQVHGTRVLVHEPNRWQGWLRGVEADGHFATRGTALAVTVADCVPVFLAHESGSVAVLHSGWRGTAGRIVEAGVAAFTARGIAAGELRVHLGPAICGKCYEVSEDVARQVTGTADKRRTVDLRAVIAGQLRNCGVRQVSISASCTRCNNDSFYSHRAGDWGRQVGVIISGA